MNDPVPVLKLRLQLKESGKSQNGFLDGGSTALG